ncbi:hypothetical protein DVR12_22515 [Chitinophaga silvatica]|uniref:Uncharacterized protein n=1 Tax=Chitinophaga silvatica TaxID=2282649 RepID=A0A3E1Y401_9BACT|nr:hypothetical protein [Chitinophaga silvatica]RFS19411.1 hypothetical protein DVR12_22515 [Chitinophaga silvatica]
MKLMSYRNLIPILFLIPHLNLFAQAKSEKLNKFIYNKIANNLFAFNLRHANLALNGVVPEEVLDGGSYEFYGFILPDFGQKLIMEIDTSELIYPLSKFEVFKVYIPGFKFLDSVSNTITTPIGIGLTTKDFLIAVDVNSEYPHIKFLSGQFYPTRVSYDFNINLMNPNSCLDYLRFRMYSYKVKDIIFDKRNKEGLLFKGYSEVEKSPVQILLPKDDIERPYIVKLLKMED